MDEKNLISTNAGLNSFRLLLTAEKGLEYRHAN